MPAAGLPAATAKRKKARRGGRGDLTVALEAKAGDEAGRQCCVCRARRPRLALLEVRRGQADTRRRSYVCIAHKCLQAVADRSGDDQPLHEVAKVRISACVGLARRAGKVRLGASGLVGQTLAIGAIALCASDAAERTKRALGDTQKPVPHTSAELGQAAGATRPVAAVLLEPSRHAEQAAYWQQVWYETRPREGQRHIEVGQ